MKWTTFPAIIVIAVACIAPPAGATDFVYDDGGFGNAWGTIANWFPDGTPGANDKATIGSQYTVTISVADQEIQVLDLQGTLIIYGGKTLTLHDSATEDSIIDGILQLGLGGEMGCFPLATPDATLAINDSTTIKGDGGTIVCRCADPSIVTAAGASGPNTVLTLVNSGTGTLTVTTGTGCTSLDIGVKLVNNARVGPDGAELILSTQTKTGSGEWFATGAGKLTVDVGVRGSASWCITSTSSLSEIEINARCKVSGDVFMERGLLDANEKFCTLGHLTMRDADKLESIIDAAPSKYALFAALSCP